MVSSLSRFLLLLALSTLLPLRCFSQDLSLPKFEDVSARAGLTTSHIGAPEKRYIVESTSGGVGFIDCDNDGKLDILMVGGSNVDHYRQSGGDPMIRLFHQDANLHFTDITETAGLTRKGWGMAISVMDFDNDGWQDIYVTGYGGKVLYRNLGNCKFEDVTEKAGVRVGGYSMGAAWADYDRDGYVDLFVPRYLDFDMNKLPTYDAENKGCEFRGVSMECARRGHSGQTDFLFHNRGNGTFEDVSKKAGVDDPGTYLGMQAIWADYDNDGWPDLYVTNDGGPNYLYRNKHDGTFEDVGMISGVALSGDGLEQGSMGVDWGDYRHEGRMGMFVTNFVEQGNTLYRNLGDQGLFSDVSWPSKLAQPSFPLVGWGTSFFDMDNDTWLDIFVANGHVYPQVDSIPGGARYKQSMLLFRNNRDGTFEDVSTVLSAIPAASRRGAAFGDINNDGNVDIVIVNVGEPPSLLLNQGSNGNHRVLFKLIGMKSNKSGIGARVTVMTATSTQFNEVRGGGSYLSQNDPRLHFGLGADSKISQIEIRWPNGKIETLRERPADFIYTIVEGQGITNKKALPAAAAP